VATGDSSRTAKGLKGLSGLPAVGVVVPLVQPISTTGSKNSTRKIEFFMEETPSQGFHQRFADCRNTPAICKYSLPMGRTTGKGLIPGLFLEHGGSRSAVRLIGFSS
jgi:hypothetical protein